MLLTIQDVRREVFAAVSRVRIIDSATVIVAPGDHPMQPSVVAVGDVSGLKKESHIDMVSMFIEFFIS